MADKPSLVWVEQKAQLLREHLQLSPLAILDPVALAHKMGIKLLTPLEIPNLPDSTKKQLLVNGSDSWSAGCMLLPNNLPVIIFNPNHAPTRQRATLMEELSHVFLDHKGSELITENESVFRSYNKKEETQAYWVGAAALLPRAVLKQAKERHISRNELARAHGVSPALVRFRGNILHLNLA